MCVALNDLRVQCRAASFTKRYVLPNPHGRNGLPVVPRECRTITNGTPSSIFNYPCVTGTTTRVPFSFGFAHAHHIVIITVFSPHRRVFVLRVHSHRYPPIAQCFRSPEFRDPLSWSIRSQRWCTWEYQGHPPPSLRPSIPPVSFTTLPGGSRQTHYRHAWYWLHLIFVPPFLPL